jgi:hypothetical protein
MCVSANGKVIDRTFALGHVQSSRAVRQESLHLEPGLFPVYSKVTHIVWGSELSYVGARHISQPLRQFLKEKRNLKRNLGHLPRHIKGRIPSGITS